MLAVLVYLCISFLLPEIVYCNDVSHQLLSSLWPREFIRIQNKCFGRELAIFSKTVRAQRRIKYCYGTTVFDQETKTNFYWNVLEHTFNLLLLQ